MKRMRQIWLAGLVLLSLSAEVSAQSNVAMQDSIPEIVVTLPQPAVLYPRSSTEWRRSLPAK